MKAVRHTCFQNVTGSPYASGVIVFPPTTDLRVDTGNKYRTQGFTSITPVTCGIGWKREGGLWRVFKVRVEGRAVLSYNSGLCTPNGQMVWGDGALGDRPMGELPQGLWQEIDHWACAQMPEGYTWDLAGISA